MFLKPGPVDGIEWICRRLWMKLDIVFSDSPLKAVLIKVRLLIIRGDWGLVGFYNGLYIAILYLLIHFGGHGADGRFSSPEVLKGESR